jgi:hypothetical protein
MTSDQANKLQAEWGDKPCDHPDIIAEEQVDGVTHDKWRCTTCGTLVDYDEWRRSQHNRL